MNKKRNIALILLIIMISIMVLTACNKTSINLTLDANGGLFKNGKAIDTHKTDGISTITMPDDPTREGYTFKGWFWDKDVWERQFTWDSLLRTPVDSDTTIYAKWEEITLIEYTVIFDSKGGDIIPSITVNEGQVIETPSLSERPGYTFDGWYLDEDYNESSKISFPYTLTDNITLYAKWEEIALIEYTVTFDSKGGDAISSITVNEGQAIDTPSLSERSGYTFDGWYLDEDYDEYSKISFPYILTDNVTLYAKWLSKPQVFQYSLEESTNSYAVIGYIGEELSIEIPSKHNGKTVTSIGSNAFRGQSLLTNIYIPSSVTEIGESAFAGVSGKVIFQENTTISAIGNGVFRDYLGIEINIPNSVSTIGEEAFNECINLTKIVLPKNVSSIGNRAFYECNSLQAIEVDSDNPTYKSIDGVLYNKDTTLLIQYPLGKGDTNYTIPSGVEVIGKMAFSSANGLVGITIPGCVISIKDGAFNRCNSLSNIVIRSAEPPILGTEVFCSTSDSLRIYVPSDSLGDYKNSLGWNIYQARIFSQDIVDDQGFTIENGRLTQYIGTATDIVIPNSVAYIDNTAFDSNINLEKITIHSGVIEIAPYSFAYCNNLENIVVESDNPNYKSIDGVLYNKDSTLLIQYPLGKAGTSYTVPDSVNTIGSAAFYKNISLEEIIIPDSVASIDDYAFFGCLSLIEIAIPKSVKEIKLQAFSNCESLENINLSEVEIIDSWAFSNCKSLESIIIPNSITYIGDNAFSGCNGLVSITIERGYPPNLGQTPFQGTHNDMKIYVLSDSFDTFKTVWSRYRERIRIIS